MPVTPFHFGPGILVKSMARQRFSLAAFIVSQIFVDVETAWNFFTHAPRLHTWFHSFAGSLIPAALTVLALQIYSQRIRWSTLILSALVGVWSHVILDGIMHKDARPFMPFSSSNPFLGTWSVLTLHLVCVFSGLVGWLIWTIRTGDRGSTLTSISTLGKEK